MSIGVELEEDFLCSFRPRTSQRVWCHVFSRAFLHMHLGAPRIFLVRSMHIVNVGDY